MAALPARANVAYFRNRVEARAQLHPPASRPPPWAVLSLARERFAEKQTSGSRPCPVARRSRYRPIGVAGAAWRRANACHELDRQLAELAHDSRGDQAQVRE
jgi:hypothetical protein